MYFKHLTYHFGVIMLLFGCAVSQESNEPLPCKDIANCIPVDTELSQQTEITDPQGNIYQIGFDQVSANNQDSYIIKKDPSGQQLWKHYYDQSPVDSKGLMISIDSNEQLWAIFTVDGGSYDEGYLTKNHVETDAFKQVYASSYGNGGGPRVVVLARIHPSSGKIIKGTFLTARLNSGKTNGFNVTKMGFSNGHVALLAETAAWPPGAGRQYQKMADITDADRIDNAFHLYYEVATSLDAIESAKLIRE